MNKRVFIFAGVILLLVLIGYVLYSNFEIYEFTESTDPSREVLENRFYAMEQWLKQTGHPVRFENTFNPSKLATAQERVVIVHSSASRWDNAGEYILPWIEQGGYLVISLDNYGSYLDENLLEFLSNCGVGINENERILFSVYSDRNIFFTIDDGIDVLTLNDEEGFTWLVEIPIGNGALTVTGVFVFMFNYNLTHDINASLAWNLTGARANGENSGVLFVRKRNLPNNMFGKIMERGNLLPIAISALLLIVFGFWMVIPVFGLVTNEKQTTSRPIRDRFIAEIRFLKKYRALDHYLNVYEQDKNPEEKTEKKEYNYRELINQYRRIFYGTEKF